MTETILGMELIVLHFIKERGGTALVVSQISMGFTLMARATTVVSHGDISMPLHQIGVHFAIQTWSWEEVAEDLPHCHHDNPWLHYTDSNS